MSQKVGTGADCEGVACEGTSIPCRQVIQHYSMMTRYIKRRLYRDWRRAMVLMIIESRVVQRRRHLMLLVAMDVNAIMVRVKAVIVNVE